MRYPDFLVVGAAKSGTTSLWKYFQEHSQIFVTNDIRYKELGYFSDNYGINDEQKYLKHFLPANDNQYIGEVCHSYLSNLSCAKVIREKISNVKIIIMLRNPTDRAFSLYNWMVLNGYEDAVSFEQALFMEKGRLDGEITFNEAHHTFINNYLYYNSGLYFEQVKRYIEEFGVDNVRVYLYENYTNSQEQVLKSICDFLNVSMEKIKVPNINKSYCVKSALKQFNAYKILRGRSSFGQNKLGQHYAKRIIRKNISKTTAPKMEIETRRSLQLKYERDVSNLSELIKVDLKSIWS